MAMELKQSLRLSQQLVMTPQLQQAIKLLQLNRQELMEMVNQELVENPVLDETQDDSEAPSGEGSPDADESGEAPSSDTPQDPEMEQRRDEEAFQNTQTEQDKLAGGKEDIDWEQYINDFSSNQSTAPSMREINEDLPSFENALTKTTTLEDHLRWQLSMATLAENEKKLGELIIGNLGSDGYLKVALEDIARESGMELEDAVETLKLMQNFDPVGVCSRDLRECLLAQAAFLTPRQPLVETMIDQHMSLLEKKNYSGIAKALGVTLEKVIEATKIILEFEPKPGSAFADSEPQYITPDIYVYKVGDEYVISLNEDGMPKLRVSPYYKNLLTRGKTVENKVEREYIQEKLRSALWLIRSIHNRQKTIYKVTEAIVTRQRDFFEKGVSCLKPMILKDIAGDIGMHESTISRVTTNKYVHTPVGIFELKYFFNSSINSADGGDALASEAVKEKIKALISKEDQKNPLSDQRIVELLKGDNIDIARRTVAKYREMAGILSSSKRKKVF